MSGGVGHECIDGSHGCTIPHEILSVHKYFDLQNKRTAAVLTLARVHCCKRGYSRYPNFRCDATGDSVVCSSMCYELALQEKLPNKAKSASVQLCPEVPHGN